MQDHVVEVVSVSKGRDVTILWVVVAELESGRMERQVFLADRMKRPDQATLENRSAAFDGIGMHRANHLLLLSGIDHFSSFCLRWRPVHL